MMNSFQKMSEKILLYQDIISQRNYVNIRKFTTGGMLLTGGVSLAALLSGGQLSFAAEYCACFAVFVLSYLFTRFILVKNVKHTAIAFYCMLLPIYAAGILMGTFLDPESSAITIYILLCTLTMFITDKPQRLLGFLFAIAIVFLLCSYLCKEPNIFVADLVNLLIYFSIGLGEIS